jgi:hypothetical protein
LSRIRLSVLGALEVVGVLLAELGQLLVTGALWGGIADLAYRLGFVFAAEATAAQVLFEALINGWRLARLDDASRVSG